MPHCIIEYSDTLETILCPNELMRSVYLGALSSELFDADDIKTRLVSFQHFASGDIKQDFIHVVLKILSGRSNEQRKALSNSVLTELNRLPLSSISLTVEVVEIEKSSYSKVVK